MFAFLTRFVSSNLLKKFSLLYLGYPIAEKVWTRVSAELENERQRNARQEEPPQVPSPQPHGRAEDQSDRLLH